MGITQQQQMAERLLDLIGACPNLPVKRGAMGLDRLETQGRSISLALQPGQVIKTDISGRKTIRQPFGLSYRAANTDDDAVKAAMIGDLNGIGAWLDTLDPADIVIGDGVAVTKLEQTSLAFIIEQSEGNIAYQGDYVVEYSQKRGQ